MKKVVSIDVGIRNLSFCFFGESQGESQRIIKWDNIDLTEREVQLCSTDGCKKAVKYTKHEQYWCLLHSKKQPFMVPTKELTKTSLNKTKVQGLKELLEKYGVQCYANGRADMVAALLAHGEMHCFESKTQVNAVHLNLVVIGRNIQHKLDVIFGEDISTIDTVIIENQIGPLATKMKTVQGMLAQYFIMKNNNIKIEFVSSANKLKGQGEGQQQGEGQLDYKGRKKLGVQCCKDKLIGVNVGWLPFFNSHKKKDDLADCFLQGLWYLNKGNTNIEAIC
jgi:hypothetical protein